MPHYTGTWYYYNNVIYKGLYISNKLLMQWNKNWFQLSLKKIEEISVVRPPYTVHWEYRSGVAHINWAGESCAYEAAVLGPLLSRKYIFWYANLFPVCFSIQWSCYAYLIFLLVVPLMNKTLWYKCHWICCQ
jgi:hypothetical protein